MFDFLNDLNGWTIALGTFPLLLAALEAGFRHGRRTSRHVPPDDRPQVGTVQGAVLGLLALLLGFSFAMAASRFEVRKQVVLDEANALGTAYLRTRLLPQPQRAEAAEKLREYTAVRVTGYRRGATAADVAATDRELVRLQGVLWELAGQALDRNPESEAAALFAQSLNDVIDLHEKRVCSLENHVPPVIVLVLVVASAAALALTGYGGGLSGVRNVVPNGIAVALVVVVLGLVIDLDRPGQGLIQIGQKSFTRLQAGMAK